jgi:hypothetical protein
MAIAPFPEVLHNLTYLNKRDSYAAVTERTYHKRYVINCVSNLLKILLTLFSFVAGTKKVLISFTFP